jgi:lipopolysaccharide transport system ATP-binding protein
MAAAAVTVEGISKLYRIGQLDAAYDTLRDTISASTRRFVERVEHRGERRPEIWALKDVSFQLEQGEVLGIIGKNGAGKSTLLRVLTRITTPTAGRAEIRGRVGSLLEIGTGFHPELTGRENVSLNGAILGMGRRELKRKFDDIVEFSGVSQFLDTPVKRYSSGMYVRLAFAVAAHLEPEVLLVDEVLAVGDFEFQRRCLGRMQDLSSEGRTVIFVSHQLQVMARLCDRAILLDRGQLVRDGEAGAVVAQYLQTGQGVNAERVWTDLETAPGDWTTRLRSVRVVDEDGHTSDHFDVRRPIGVELAFHVSTSGKHAVPKIKVLDQQGDTVFNALDISPRWQEPVVPGDYVSTAWIPGNLLNEGLFTVDAALVVIGAEKLRPRAAANSVVAFHVQDPGEGSSARGTYTGHLSGPVRPLLEWTTEQR